MTSGTGNTANSSCVKATCPAISVANSVSHTGPGSVFGVLGDVVKITCMDGHFADGIIGRRVTESRCEAVTGTDKAKFSAVTCKPSMCPATGGIADSDRSGDTSIAAAVLGSTVAINCDTCFSGSGIATSENFFFPSSLVLACSFSLICALSASS